MNEEKLKDAEIKRLETELDMVQTAWQVLKDENNTLNQRITELERENQSLKEETVRIYQQMLSLYRAVKAANCNLDAVEEKCDNNVWFQKIKERTY